MNETVLVSLIVSVIAPLVLGFVTNWSRRLEKREDWSRQDQVAAKAEEAARLLLVENKRAAISAIETNNKLDTIHTLVNSNMTAAMQAQLVALKGQLILMERVTDLNKKAGTPQTEDEAASIKAVAAQINELSAALNDRMESTKKVTAAAAERR